jgi:hypothetical protein
MDIVPAHEVPALSPVAFTETVKFEFDVPAVKLPVGDMLSQVLPVQLCSETWAVAAVFVDAVTVRVCEGGADPPATALNVKASWLKFRLPVVPAVTSRVMLKVSDPWFETTWRVLVYLPTWRLVGSTAIVRDVGVTVAAREAFTQLAPSVTNVTEMGGVPVIL